MNHYNGLSSLLFLISTIKSFCVSKLILWKIANSVLIVASYLFNSTHHDTYLFIDYLAISFACASYINHAHINSILMILFMNEYERTQNIVSTKNITFGCSIIKSIYNTYYYVDNTHFYIIVSSTASGVVSYLIRLNLHKDYDNKYFVLLTWCLHFSIMCVMYVCSITAT